MESPSSLNLSIVHHQTQTGLFSLWVGGCLVAINKTFPTTFCRCTLMSTDHVKYIWSLKKVFPNHWPMVQRDLWPGWMLGTAHGFRTKAIVDASASQWLHTVWPWVARSDGNPLPQRWQTPGTACRWNTDKGLRDFVQQRFEQGFCVSGHHGDEHDREGATAYLSSSPLPNSKVWLHLWISPTSCRFSTLSCPDLSPEPTRVHLRTSNKLGIPFYMDLDSPLLLSFGHISS